MDVDPPVRIPHFLTCNTRVRTRRGRRSVVGLLPADLFLPLCPVHRHTKNGGKSNHTRVSEVSRLVYEQSCYFVVHNNVTCFVVHNVVHNTKLLPFLSGYE